MKLGISCFSLNAHQKDGTMTILDIVDWAAQHNSEHLELVPFDIPFPFRRRHDQHGVSYPD